MVRPPKSVNAAALSRVVMDAPRNAGTSSTTADTVSVTNMSSREIGMRPSPIRDTAVAGESYPTIDALPGAILTELHGIREVLERRSRPRDADDLRVGRLLALHVGSKRLAACDVTALACDGILTMSCPICHTTNKNSVDEFDTSIMRLG